LKGEKRNKMKKCIVLLFLLLLLLSVVGCSAKNESVSQKNNSISHYQGYGIETQRNDDKLTVKTDSSEWSVKVLPKELSLEQEFALETWEYILNVPAPVSDPVSERKKYIEEKNKAKAIIESLVERLAAGIKTGQKDFKDVPIGFKDVEKALNILWETSFIAADRFGGNRDGYCSNPEIYKLRMSLQSQVVAMMTKTYIE